jgi:hypothetical protein
VDSAGRWRRWLFSGLHRLDFTEFMRARPFRDVLMWLTLLGGLGVSITGVWLAFRRIRSDVIVLSRPLRRFTMPAANGNSAPFSDRGQRGPVNYS